MSAEFALPNAHVAKAQQSIRALRRAVLAYWYATIEDAQAALIEAANATYVINTLDEAIFEDAFGAVYQAYRRRDRLGRVVMGLELIRNCETHAAVAFDGLLVADRYLGVPIVGAESRMRAVYRWAEFDSLPIGYRDLPATTSSPTRRRARGEAQDGYRKAVQERHVIETLLDAVAFFERLDDRLVADDPPAMRWAFGVLDLPDTDPAVAPPARHYVARPLGLDRWAIFLPDMACRTTERRMARWAAADVTLADLVRQARRGVPGADAREVQFRVLDPSGALVGFSGYTQPAGGGRTAWVERTRQVWQDVRRGYRYYCVGESGDEVDVGESGQHSLGARDVRGIDRLLTLPTAVGPPDYASLCMRENYDDLYLQMRQAT